MKRGLHFDVVVIGTGVAGLVAGTRLAQAGARVCVLAKGVGSTHLAPGAIDVLGYLPGDGGAGTARVDSPLEAIGRLPGEHPFVRMGGGVVEESLRWFQSVVEAGPFEGYGYVGGPDRNFVLPTAVGSLKPSAVVPTTFAAGDAPGLSRVCIAGTPALRDFQAGLCAANLTAAGVDARAVQLEIEADRADATTVGLARALDDPKRRAELCGRLSALLGGEEHVGLPAILGLRDPGGVHADLERRLGRRVFEIPTLPPSVPGIRLYEILRAALRAAGGRHVLGAEVVECGREGDRILSVATESGARDVFYEADWFVLASGGFASGAIEVDSHWVTREKVMGLELAGVPGEGEPRFTDSYLAEQPMSRAGVRVDGELHAQGLANVLVAGGALPGAVPWREGSGEGIALASGFRAAQIIAESTGSWAEREVAA